MTSAALCVVMPKKAAPQTKRRVFVYGEQMTCCSNQCPRKECQDGNNRERVSLGALEDTLLALRQAKPNDDGHLATVYQNTINKMIETVAYFRAFAVGDSVVEDQCHTAAM